MTEAPPFERTKCACAECVKCCKRQPGPLIPGDLERIAEFLGATVDDIKGFFWASPGALVRNFDTGKTERVGTITPRYDRRKKRCVFLDDKDRCRIHTVAPAGCSHFDTHMNLAEAHSRSLWMVTKQTDTDYQQLRGTLPMATHYKPLGYKNEYE